MSKTNNYSELLKNSGIYTVNKKASNPYDEEFDEINHAISGEAGANGSCNGTCSNGSCRKPEDEAEDTITFKP